MPEETSTCITLNYGNCFVLNKYERLPLLFVLHFSGCTKLSEANRKQTKALFSLSHSLGQFNVFSVNRYVFCICITTFERSERMARIERKSGLLVENVDIQSI